MIQKLTGRTALQVGLVCIATASVSWSACAQSTKLDPPSWAYPEAGKGVPESDAPRTVPGSKQHYTIKEINNLSNPPDWFPDEHAPMPKVVRLGDGQGRLACIACHLASGEGHPESSHLSGLPKAYIVEQLDNFRGGVRKDRFRMSDIARSLTDGDISDAATWFSRLPARQWTRVVEADEVPKSYLNGGRMRIALDTGEKEPLGDRIIELPENSELAIDRDPKSGFVAYVPRGSIARGKILVTNGAGRTLACAACHGASLKGSGNVPRLAGISPLYIARQLVAFRNDDRGGAASQPMKSVVAALTTDDVLAISAYLSSLKP